MSEVEKPRLVVYSNDREWVRTNESYHAPEPAGAYQTVTDYPMYVLTTWNYGPGAALWGIDKAFVLVYQDLTRALGHRTGMDGRHVLIGYVDLYLTGPDQLRDILFQHGYQYDYSWLTYETAAPPIKKESS